MQKKSLLIFILGLMLINFVSAYYGSYNSFSLGNLLDSIDSSTIVLGSIFLISFALLNFSLSRVFKDQYGNPNKISGVIALLVSLLIIYGINKTGFDYESLFYGIGFSSDLLSFLAPIVLLVGAILLIWKLKFSGFFLISGAVLVLLSYFTDLIYENGIATIIGVTFLLIGLWLWRRKKKQVNEQYSQEGPTGPGVLRRGAGAVRRGAGKGLRGATSAGAWTAKKGWGATKGAAKGATSAGAWTGKKAWGATKGVAKGATSAGAWTGKKAWGATKGVAKGTASAYQTGKEYIDPRNKLTKYQQKRDAKIQERTTKEAALVKLKRQKEVDKAEKQARIEDRIRKDAQVIIQNLQTQYDQHINAANAIVKQVGHNPKKGTKEYNEWGKHYWEGRKIEKHLEKAKKRLIEKSKR